MSDDKTTEDSKTELTESQLDDVQGGAGYLKIGDIKGEVAFKVEDDTDLAVDKSSTILKR